MANKSVSRENDHLDSLVAERNRPVSEGILSAVAGNRGKVE